MSMLLGELDLNAAPAVSALAKVDASFKRTTSTMSGFGASLAAPLAGLLTFAAVLNGFKDVLDLGGGLADLSANTGVAVDELVILKAAFGNAGIEGEQMSKLLTKANITSIAGIEALSAEYQGLGSQQEKNAFLADKFGGKQGFKLGALLGDPGAMAFAREQAGPLAAIMDKNVAAFDRLGDVMNGLKLNVQEFFAGALSKIAPEATNIAQALAAIDFVGVGEKAGALINPFLQLISVVAKFSSAIEKLAEIGGMVTGITPLMNLIEKFSGGQKSGTLAESYRGFAKLAGEESSPAKSIVGSLQKSGGGGFFGGGADPVLSENRRQSRLLEQIATNTARREHGGSIAAPAV